MSAEDLSKTSDIPPENIFFLNSLSFRMIIGVMAFIVIVLAANYFVTQTRGREVIVEQANKLNYEIGAKIKFKLRERLIATEVLTTSLAKLAQTLPKDPKLFHQVIPNIINQPGMEKLVAGGGIWPEPDYFFEGVERSSFFWGRDSDGALKFYDDYNDLNGKGYHHEEWYVPTKFLAPGQVYWSKSYMDPYSREPMVTCSVPIWSKGKFQGVATIDLKLLGLSKFMSRQAALIGGYAFAMDRNDRLLSFPKDSQRQTAILDLQDFENNQYPMIEDVVSLHPAFQGIVDEIKRSQVTTFSDSQDEEISLLSANLEKQSYQIDSLESERIAAILLGFNDLRSAGQHFTINNDPILNEASSVNILALPDIGWKVVIAMPAKYANAVVAKITVGMLSSLFLVLAIVAVIYILFFNAAFLKPINKLTYQIRKLVSREDYVTKLNVNGRDELSQLASWFNIRTSQLADVLERLKTQNIDLTEAREIAEKANRSKNMFLASMSHDIRTPMNAIIGMSGFLNESTLDIEQKNYSHVIHSSAQALLSLINDIMDFSKIEANQLSLESLPFDIRQTIDDCADLISYQSAEKRLEFIYYLSPEINRHVIGDPNRIRQIILNLASNAVKFTSYGRIELWLEATYQSNKNLQLLIEVRDTGIGLSKSAQQNLFSPFVQGDASTTRKYGGTGLGLTICKHLAELMGGSIDFRSEEGVGTTFVFKVKLALAKAPLGFQELNPTINRTLLVLGQNHFQNTVIEEYAHSLGMKTHLIHTLQEWLIVHAEKSHMPLSTICTDMGLLGDVSLLAKRMPETKEKHPVVLLASQEDRDESFINTLPEGYTVNLLSLPLKLDEFKAALLEEEISAIREDLTLNSARSNQVRAASLSSFSYKRILMIEDNKVNQQILLIMLKSLGLDAAVANDGVEGIEAISNKDYDLILMDWQMPRMDGLEATRKIRAMKGDDGPVIIAVTANAMSGDVERCLDAGMDDYLSKPVQKEKLENMLRKWLSMSV